MVYINPIHWKCNFPFKLYSYFKTYQLLLLLLWPNNCIKIFKKIKFLNALSINTHMHKILSKMHKMLSSHGHKQYIFGDHFYSKNAKKLRFHVFLLFHVENICILILPEVDRLHKKLWILFQLWVSGDPN